MVKLSKLKPNQYFFIPKHGVVVVDSVDERILGGKKTTLVTFSTVNNGLTIILNSGCEEKVGIRKILSSDHAKIIFDLLQIDSEKIENEEIKNQWRRLWDALLKEYVAGKDIIPFVSKLRSLSLENNINGDGMYLDDDVSQLLNIECRLSLAGEAA